MNKAGNNTYRIGMLGATGAVGKEFVRQALEAGHFIKALVRNPDKIQGYPSDQINLIQGDAVNRDDVCKITNDVDVIISCLGTVKGQPIMETAMKHLISCASENPSKPKLIVISSIGCGDTSRIIRSMLLMIAGKTVFMDLDHADRAIRTQSELPYTLVRPYALTNKPATGRYKVLKGKGTFAKPIARSDVAKVLVDALDQPEWSGPQGLQVGGA